MPMKKGKDHHWSKPDDEKTPKQPYVPTGKPRGRPPKEENEKKAPKESTIQKK